MSKASDISGSGESSQDPMDDYKLQSDADTLQKHHEIVSDPDRHAAAHAVLQQRATDGKAAVKSSSKNLHQKVKKGLQKAFSPENGQGQTPFQKAGGSKQPAKQASDSEGSQTNG
jgi:hypothetical protein